MMMHTISPFSEFNILDTFLSNNDLVFIDFVKGEDFFHILIFK